jgi:5-formaminoimidazole-4-carboxamide-1-beta-D-ribofuranosyl 5'-monophosphate synthetase
MSDRFDLEQQILKCWNITEEIQLLNEQVLENDELTKDQISNYLLGLHTIYEMKFDKLFNQFETMVKERKII